MTEMVHSLGNPDDQRIAEEIRAIVAKETGVPADRLRDEATIEELGIPSLDLVHAIFAVETHFDVEIPVLAPHAGTEFTHVGDLIAHALTAVKAAAKSPATLDPALGRASA